MIKSHLSAIYSHISYLTITRCRYLNDIFIKSVINVDFCQYLSAISHNYEKCGIYGYQLWINEFCKQITLLVFVTFHYIQAITSSCFLIMLCLRSQNVWSITIDISRSSSREALSCFSCLAANFQRQNFCAQRKFWSVSSSSRWRRRRRRRRRRQRPPRPRNKLPISQWARIEPSAARCNGAMNHVRTYRARV